MKVLLKRFLMRLIGFPTLRTYSLSGWSRAEGESEWQYCVMQRKWFWPPSRTEYYLQGQRVHDPASTRFVRERVSVVFSFRSDGFIAGRISNSAAFDHVLDRDYVLALYGAALRD